MIYQPGAVFLPVLLQDIPGKGELLESDMFRSEWIFTILIIPLIIFTIINAVYRGTSLRTFRATFSYNSSSTIFRTSHTRAWPDQTGMAIIAIISIPTFVYFVEGVFNKSLFGLSDFRLWLINAAIILAALFFRYLASSVTGIVSGSKGIFREYLFNISQSYKSLGVILLIINFCISYLSIVPDKWLIFIGFAVISILYLLRLTRLLLLFIRRSFSIFYLILYLCALEFAPVLIFIKYLSGQIS